MSSNLFFDMNPLDTYFVNQSHNPGKLTFVNASFWEKRTAIHKPRRPFNFDLKTYPSRTILREVSRVSSLILRAKPWLVKKVLRHGKSFCRSGSQTLLFGGREATTGNASAVRRLIGFLSNFVLILKYFFLLLKLSTVMRLVTWSIWLPLKNSRAIISVQLAVLS